MRRFCVYLMLVVFVLILALFQSFVPVPVMGKIFIQETKINKNQVLFTVNKYLPSRGLCFDDLYIQITEADDYYHLYFKGVNEDGTYKEFGEYFVYPQGFANTVQKLVNQLCPPPPPEPKPQPKKKTLIEQGYRLVKFDGPKYEAGDDIRITGVIGKAFFTKNMYEVGWQVFKARWPMQSRSPLELWVPPGENPQITYVTLKNN